jgi:hypothetical protein
MLQQTSPMTASAASATQLDTETNATAGVATLPTDAASSEDNGALIGGIVGGIIALLLVGGLVAFLVARSRRHGEPNNDAALQSVWSTDMREAVDTGTAVHRSNYDTLALSPPEKNYGLLNLGAPPQYNALPAIEDVYMKPSPNHTEYEVGDLTKFIE